MTATTPHYNLRYPQETDTADVPRDMANLATDADTTLYTHESATAAHGTTGALVGTTDTQTLSNKTLVAAITDTIKATGITGATAGARFAGGTTGGAPASGTFAVGDFVIDQTGGVYVCTVAGSPGTWSAIGTVGLVTAKGDLTPGTGSHTQARLAAGADGTVLIADSTQTTGLRWGTAAGSDSTALHFKNAADDGKTLSLGGAGAETSNQGAWTPQYSLATALTFPTTFSSVPTILPGLSAAGAAGAIAALYSLSTTGVNALIVTSSTSGSATINPVAIG